MLPTLVLRLLQLLAKCQFVQNRKLPFSVSQKFPYSITECQNASGCLCKKDVIDHEVSKVGNTDLMYLQIAMHILGMSKLDVSNGSGF